MSRILAITILLLLNLAKVFSQNCPNSDFSHLNFDNWQAFIGQNSSGGMGCCPIQVIVPGRHTIISTPTVDSNTCGGLTVPPPGYPACARLGNDIAGSEAERLIYHFTVDPANPAFIFKYAVVLEVWLDVKPGTSFFSYKIFDENNNEVDPLCGSYDVFGEPTPSNFQNCATSYHQVVWRNWTTVGVDLSAYAGQQLRIEFTTKDCTDGSHFGYAYLLAMCAHLNIDQSFCVGTDSVVLTAPPDFSYQWNTGATTQSITVVNPVVGANYSCVITSSPGCTFHLTSTIAATVMTPAFVSTHDSCSRTVAFTGTSTISSGNNYASHWNFGDGSFSTVHDPVHTFPGPGTYNVTLNISTIGGCDSSVTHTVTIGNVPLALFTANDTCQAMVVNFHNNSFAQDNIISWKWKFGDGSPVNTTIWNPTHIYPTAGNYTVTLWVTNARGCKDSISQIVTIYGIPVADFSWTTPLCVGDTTTITFTGTSTPLTIYNWNFNGATVVSGSGAGPYVISWPNNGNHQVSLQITDPICNSADDIVKTLAVNATPPAEAGNDTTICLGHNITLYGSGGNGYIWSPANTLNNPFVSNPIATPTVTTTYHVTVTQDNCPATDTVVVTVEELSPVSVTPDTMICEGKKITLHASGGTQYLWSPATGLNSVNIPNPMATITNSIIYTVTISDNTNCMAIEHVLVQVSGAINSNFNVTKDTICPGENTNVYYNGGSLNPFATYYWDFNGAIISYGSGNGPFSIHWLTPGFHNVTLSVSEGTCDTSITYRTVYVTNGPVAEAGPDDTICQGETVVLNGSGGGSYSWWPGAGLVNASSANPSATPMVSTTYHVWVFSAGCISQDSMHLEVLPAPLLSAGNDTTMCTGESVQLNATGAMTYLWSPPTGLSAVNIPNPIASPLSTTLYTVLGTAPNGCTAVDQILVTVSNKPTSTFTVNTSHICAEDTLNLVFTGSSTPTATFNWNFDGASILSGSGQGPYALQWTTPGNHLLSLNVSENGCASDTTSWPVTVTKVDAQVTLHQDILCHGDSNGAITITPSGGTLPYVFTWSNLETSPALNDLPPGIYNVTVTDSGGCVGTASITIVEPDSVLSLATNFQSVTCQYLCNGEISTIVSGGTVPYSYLWNTSPALTDSALTGVCPGDYTVTVTDDHGCQTTALINMPYHTAVDASCLADTTSGLAPLTVNFSFTGFGGNALLWNFDDNTTSTLPDPTHIFEQVGTYHVTLIINSLEPDFCTDTTILTIQVDDTSYIETPNVFTPNNDGYNDFFEIKSHYLENCSIVIFNRWGTLVYKSDSEAIRWDGKIDSNTPAAEGTYFFTLDALGKDGKKYHNAGAVTLLR